MCAKQKLVTMLKVKIQVFEEHHDLDKWKKKHSLVENKMMCRKSTATRKRRIKINVQERVKGELWQQGQVLPIEGESEHPWSVSSPWGAEGDQNDSFLLSSIGEKYLKMEIEETSSKLVSPVRKLWFL